MYEGSDYQGDGAELDAGAEDHSSRCGCPVCDPDTAADMEAELLAGRRDW